MSDTGPGPLELTEAQMRRFGYSVIDLLVQHFTSLHKKAVGQRASPADIRARLNEGLPRGSEPELVLKRVERDVLPNILHLDHPRFLGFVSSPSNFVSVMADTLASGFNVFAGTWLEASGPAQVELVVLDWLKSLLGLSATAQGVLVSGGSHANLTALAVMRQVQLEDDASRAVVYASDQTHSSVARALRILGFAPKNYRRLRSTEGKLDPKDIEAAVLSDRAVGLTPACVIANAGTTNTGAVDPLNDLTSFCESNSIWLHVDGAYGAAAALSQRGQALLRGLERADSVSLDPHKWLFQPYEIGCVFLRKGEHLESTFRIVPEYRTPRLTAAK
jgi:glutamate/tyrosine decarboxylase-like PLP-dependent enzyme